jgi:predicted Holliday junction resolvase-like endonuclease
VALIVLAFLAGSAAGLLLCFFALRGMVDRRSDTRLKTWQDEAVAERIEISLQRSRAVLRGQMVEHLVPLFDEFTFGHMADARFLGKPVDFIVFDGYSELKAGTIDRLREIVFVDVKTGKSRLSSVERSIRNCVEAGRVRLVVVDHPQAAHR